MDKPFPLALLGSTLPGLEAPRAALPLTEGEGGFDLFLDDDTSVRLVEDDPSVPEAMPGWLPVADAALTLAPAIAARATDLPPALQLPPDTPAAEQGQRTGSSAPPALTADAIGPEDAAPTPPALTADAAPDPRGLTRRGRHQVKAHPADAQTASSRVIPETVDKRASRVGWVTGRSGVPVGGATASRPCADRCEGKALAGQTSPSLTFETEALSDRLVTSLRWIADPVPARIELPPEHVASRQPSPPQSVQDAAPKPGVPGPSIEPAGSSPVATTLSPSGETELTLDLAEMGSVRLRIRDRRGRLALHVLADHPATLDLLRRHADELTIALQETGLESASLSWGRATALCGLPPPDDLAKALPAEVSGDSESLSGDADRFDLLL